MNMIVQTTKEINGVVYDYAYSDSCYMIERDGVRYSEAVDPLDSRRLYTDTDLIKVANAIRAKSGTTAKLSFPDGFVQAINSIPT